MRVRCMQLFRVNVFGSLLSGHGNWGACGNERRVIACVFVEVSCLTR